MVLIAYGLRASEVENTISSGMEWKKAFRLLENIAAVDWLRDLLVSFWSKVSWTKISASIGSLMTYTTGNWLEAVIIAIFVFFLLTSIDHVLKKVIKRGEEKRKKPSKGFSKDKVRGTDVIKVTSHHELESLRNEFDDYTRKVGRLRIRICGESRDSLNLSVAVRFMDLKDEKLAQYIREFFWIGNNPPDSYPWRRTDEIDQINWFPFLRRGPTDRIIIFSDHPNAKGIQTAFNNCKLLEERVGLWDMNFAEKSLKKFDIAIVILPSESRSFDLASLSRSMPA